MGLGSFGCCCDSVPPGTNCICADLFTDRPVCMYVETFPLFYDNREGGISFNRVYRAPYLVTMQPDVSTPPTTWEAIEWIPDPWHQTLGTGVHCYAAEYAFRLRCSGSEFTFEVEYIQDDGLGGGCTLPAVAETALFVYGSFDAMPGRYVCPGNLEGQFSAITASDFYAGVQDTSNFYDGSVHVCGINPITTIPAVGALPQNVNMTLIVDGVDVYTAIARRTITPFDESNGNFGFTYFNQFGSSSLANLKAGAVKGTCSFQMRYRRFGGAAQGIGSAVWVTYDSIGDTHDSGLSNNVNFQLPMSLPFTFSLSSGDWGGDAPDVDIACRLEMP